MPLTVVRNSARPAAATAPPAPDLDLTPASAAASLLSNLLSASPPTSSLLLRALAEDSPPARATALRAGLHIASLLDASTASAFAAALSSALDSPPDGTGGEHVRAAALRLLAEAAHHLDTPRLASLVGRCAPLLASPSPHVAVAAAAALSRALRLGLRAGKLSVAGEVARLAARWLEAIRGARDEAAGREGAVGLGATFGGAGAAALGELRVVPQLLDLLCPKEKEAREAKGGAAKGAKAYKEGREEEGREEGAAEEEGREARVAAVAAVEQLALQLGGSFEPWGVGLVRQLVALYADKDRRVVDGAVRAVNAMLGRLSPLAVKLVLPALYDGMEAVQWRTKEACLQALAVLATHAPETTGPCLPVAIPKVLECLSNTNAKVQSAAATALPVLCSCVDNPETQALKSHLMAAFNDPTTTLDCLDEIMSTTFVNAVDGTSLAFIMPVVMRGLQDPRYELVEKSAVCAGNLCALVKDASEMAPFVPLLEPALTKCAEHSSPVVREKAALAKLKLLDGAGELVDPLMRPRAIGALLLQSLESLAPAAPPEARRFLADTGAELLEQRLGGPVKLDLLTKAKDALASHLSEGLAACDSPVDTSLAPLCTRAVDEFKLHMSERQKAMLAKIDGADYAVDLQNCILAFAGRVLLRQADICFERGHRYGLIGQNGVGKTTLLNRLAAKNIHGFPQELRVHYIQHAVVCDEGIDVRTYMKSQAPPHLSADDVIVQTLDEVGFPEKLQLSGVTQLSGGWKMKLSIAVSLLHQPELLLLDEPTNHLDRNAVDWLTTHLNSLDGVTIGVVSHDYAFIDRVVTDVVHYDNGGKAGQPCVLNYYAMTFSQFQKLHPEVAAGLPNSDKAVARMTGDAEPFLAASGRTESLEATILKVDEMVASGQILPIRFPDPGKPEGIRTYRKPIMTLKNISFTYEGSDKPVLTDASVSVTLGSRVVLLGANGAGKTTFLKILVGDLEANQGQGEAWTHHNLRVSYIAQHSLHHLEEYLNSNPIAYLQERFRIGLDREVQKLKTHTLLPEEKEEMKQIGSVCDVVGRQQRGKDLWYEIVKTGRRKDDTQWFPEEEIKKMFPKPYVQKLIKNYDEKSKALQSGLAVRPITAEECLNHLADFGITSDLAHGKIKQLSGGQRQRLVISAAFWSKPHLIALDEPTNYLDNDTLAALTQALKDFKGAVVTVSHNEAFVAEISNEKWVVENGQITVVQLRDAKMR